MTIDKAKLKALAEAATQDHGARRVEVDQNGRNVIGDGSWKIFIAWHTPDGRGKENADFCAAASPSTILALLGEIERLESDAASMRGSLKAQGKDLTTAVRKCSRAVRERDQLKAENEALRKALCDCADELQAEVICKHAGQKVEEMHPAARRLYHRDMAAVVHARAAMAKEQSNG